MIKCATMLLAQPEEDEGQNSHGGSRPGKHPNLPQNFEIGYKMFFCCCFCMSRSLFLHIATRLEQYESYFTHRADALGRWGIRPLVKITSALRMLAYGGAADCNDEYLQISESTSLECMDKFFKAIVAL